MPKRIKIIHICDKFGVKGSTVHGASKLISWWLPAFDKTRFEAKLYGVKSPDVSSLQLESEGIHIDYMRQSALSPRILSAFLRVIRNEQADILHLHGWIAANFGRIAGRIAGIPTIMHEHGVDPSFPASQKAADRFISRYTHTAVAVSNSVRDFLITKRFVSPDKIKVIYNGTPIRLFSVPSDDVITATRNSLNIPVDSPVIGTVGRLDTQKGITYFLNAARKITERYPAARFLIVGDGPKKEELTAEARSLGLTENVIFTGHRNDLPALAGMFDVQVFPSLWEGLPLTLIESMAAGRTIVSTDVDGLGEVLTNKKDALVIKPRDPQAIAESVITLLADRQFARELGEEAKKRSNDFDSSVTVAKLESLYAEICGE